MNYLIGIEYPFVIGALAIPSAAAFAKWDDPGLWREFCSNVSNRHSLGTALFFAVPVAEILVVISAFFDAALSIFLLSGLMTTFAAAVAILVPRVGGTPCRCFGTASSRMISYALAVRNASLGLLSAGLAIAVLHSDTFIGGPPIVFAAIVVAFASLALLPFAELRRDLRIA